jgi:predicted nucleotidyltransferase component of viral defense system
MKIDLLSKAQLSIINKNNYRYPLAVAEKDYFLAVVLEILYASKLKDNLVFKGGTALHHLYLDQLRFSEDLDFGTLGKVALSDLEEVFSGYDCLEIKKVSPSDFSLKIDRLKFAGPLGQPNSIKIDIDLTQDILLPVRDLTYHNVYRAPVIVTGMDLIEICAEKVRAINERARYRDFYDLAMSFKKKGVEPVAIISTLNNKELRKPLCVGNIMGNLSIAQAAKDRGLENLFCREEIGSEEIKQVLDKLIRTIQE